MSIQDLIDMVKEDMRLAYGDDAVTDVVINGNTFSFVAYHDDGDIKCICNDASALLKMMEHKSLGQQLMIFWDTIDITPHSAAK